MKMFRNDAERQDWINGYTADDKWPWEIWCEYPLINRRFWKAELCGVWFIHEERLQTVYNPFMEPHYKKQWTTCGGYIIPDASVHSWNPLEDYKASKTQMLNKIKELEKGGK